MRTMDEESTPSVVRITPTRRQTRKGLSRSPSTFLVITHWVSLALAAAIILAVDRTTWFFADEFDFLNRVAGPQSANTWFLPHNEHWSTVPLAVYWVIFQFAKMHTYWPYITFLVIAHLSLVHLVWRLMLRVGAAPPIATGFAFVLAVLGAGAENLTWAFQIGFIFSVYFGIAAVYFADSQKKWNVSRVAILWALLLLSLASSGLGIPMLLCIAIVVLVRRGWRPMIAVLSVPVVVYAIWYELYGYQGISGYDKITLDKILDLPSYAWTGLTHALENTSGIPSSGAVLFLALCAYAIWRGQKAGGETLAAFALFAGAVFALLFIGLARTEFGAVQATSPRYAYMTMMLLAPMIALALSEFYARSVPATIVVCVFGILIVGNNIQLLNQWTVPGSSYIAATEPARVNLLGAAHLLETRAKVIGPGTPQLGNQQSLAGVAIVPVAWAQQWVRNGDISTTSATPAGILGAESYLQVLLTKRPLFNRGVAPARVVDLNGAVDSGRCLVLVPGAAPELDVVRPTSFSASGLTTNTLAYLWLVSTTRTGKPAITGPHLRLSSTGGSTSVNVSRVGDLTFDNAAGNPVRICGISD